MNDPVRTRRSPLARRAVERGKEPRGAKGLRSRFETVAADA